MKCMVRSQTNYDRSSEEGIPVQETTEHRTHRCAMHVRERSEPQDGTDIAQTLLPPVQGRAQDVRKPIHPENTSGATQHGIPQR